MLACLRSTLEYFTGKQYGWKELEELTGYDSGRAAWTVKVWTYLAQHGFEICMIENFDYNRYRAEGRAYLQSHLKPEELEWQEQHSNVLEIIPMLPDFLKRVHHETRSPKLTDIDRMLTDGYLVIVQLNSKMLNDLDGYSAHAILVYDKDGAEYVAHDPGLPPQRSRRIGAEQLFAAMGGEGNTVEVTGLRLAV